MHGAAYQEKGFPVNGSIFYEWIGSQRLRHKVNDEGGK
jgi:hypothetical protein